MRFGIQAGHEFDRNRKLIDRNGFILEKFS